MRTQPVSWLALAFALEAACTIPSPRMVVDDTDARSIPPVSRLGRWDGTRFVEVTPGTLPPSTLRVLVHGWTPGWDRRGIREGHRHAWDLTSDTGEPFEPWMTDMARVITAHDPHAVVVVYSWADDSSTIATPLAERRALALTTIYGEVLADAIDAGLAEDFYSGNGQIQLVGHSYGARVAAVAANAMDRPPAQLTLFDAPEAPMVEFMGSDTDVDALLRSLPLGWGAGEVFVDNYVSMIGRRYAWEDGLQSVRDVSLSPPFGSFRYRSRHLYPMRFYEDSPGRGYGYDWSPLTGRAQPPESGCWEQRIAGVASLTLGCTWVP
jgi:hypothetical protein